ncbi:MAG: DEAD/DEAH box helicase family protein [Planctomycetota bacterium]
MQNYVPQISHGSHRDFSEGSEFMKSVNFEFLRQEWPHIASLAGFAEMYANTDPISSLIKLRTYAEQIVEVVYEQFGLQRPYNPNLINLLNDDSFKESVPQVVVTTMHAIRKHGNIATHRNEGSEKTALWLIEEAHKLGQWLFLSFTGHTKTEIPEYKKPTPEDFGVTSKSQLQREKKSLLQKMNIQEEKMQQLLDELEAIRREAKVAKASEEELKVKIQRAQTTLNVLNFNEEETRKHLIDTMLVEAGWNVGSGVLSTNDVGKEVEIRYQPTSSGLGAADYVLFDEDGYAPLAVIEAKRTSYDPNIGRQQAKDYADGLEKERGQRPIIFYTNGFDIWIWDDARGYRPRKLFGYYSRDSLRFLIHQRKNTQNLSDVSANTKIIDRRYQIESVTRVKERFQNKYRKSLIVQATGTGKTRVVIALCEAMLRAGWVKRILFLCDRRELRKQAKNAFSEFMQDESIVYVTSKTYQDKHHKIYLATYPAMMKWYDRYDVGFFDLVIADESHRSIYNRYRELFYYFDALQVGLTATPVNFVSRNTYRLFECEDKDPTAHYDYDDAVKDGYLTPFEVRTFTTPFLREGIKWSQMTENQKRELEEQEEAPETVEYEQREVDKYIFNRDTNRLILQNLMEKGIKINDGSVLGRTIIFARNHNHAVLLQNVFDEIYPQYGGNFCRVIDNYDPRAEELIDDFKGVGKNKDLTIAISVDMLDTGIDVPEIVNLVFAKPVYSYVKFWQMIGRGTRLCKKLFGHNKDKSKFLIFDHWSNFKYFDEKYTEPDDNNTSKSLQRLLFEDRIGLAETAIDKQNTEGFDIATNLLLEDVRSLPDKTLAVRNKWREVKTVQADGVIKAFNPNTRIALKNDIAPLMQWRDISGHQTAYRFDRLCCQLQIELLKQSGRFHDLKDMLVQQVAVLQINLNPVKAKMSVIDNVKSGEFWAEPSLNDIETIRAELRGIMKYRASIEGPGPSIPKVIDIAEDISLVEDAVYKPRLVGLELIEYRNRVQSVLLRLMDQSPALQKLRMGQAITTDELKGLAALVVAQEPDLKLEDLKDYYPEADSTETVIRSIVGLDADAVEQRFTEFVQKHNLNSAQQRFLDLLKTFIARHGSIEIGDLYEAPFTSLSSEGLDGVFEEPLAVELIKLVESFKAI